MSTVARTESSLRKCVRKKPVPLGRKSVQKVSSHLIFFKKKQLMYDNGASVTIEVLLLGYRMSIAVKFL
jgi:hypothetical protein